LQSVIPGIRSFPSACHWIAIKAEERSAICGQSSSTPIEPPKDQLGRILLLEWCVQVYGERTERDWVYIVHKSDPAAAFQLYGTEPNELGIQIVKLDWHPENPVNTSVILKKGTESATLDRDRAAFAAPPSTAPKPPVNVARPLIPGTAWSQRQYIPKR
jgi:hypothetical protein